MTDDPRGRALAFLLDEHLLSRTEAETALAVAGPVLRAGLARLDAALAAGADEDCQEAAHALKGCLLNLGLDGAADLAQRLEDAARRGDLAVCRNLARNLAADLEPFFE